MEPVIYFCNKCKFKSKKVLNNKCPNCGNLLLASYNRKQLLDHLKKEVLPRRIKFMKDLIDEEMPLMIKQIFVKSQKRLINDVTKKIINLQRKVDKDFAIQLKKEIKEMLK